MKIYWAPNQTKSRIGNTPWKMEYLMNTLSGGLVTAVAPVVIQVGFTTKMIQTDMAIWKMDETDMTIFMMGETTWPEQYQHLCISGHSLGSALAYWISRKQRWPTNLKVFTHITTLFRVKDYGLVGLGQRWTRENKYLSRTPRWRSSLFIDGHSLLIILPPNVNNHPQWNLAHKKW